MASDEKAAKQPEELEKKQEVEELDKPQDLKEEDSKKTEKSKDDAKEGDSAGKSPISKKSASSIELERTKAKPKVIKTPKKKVEDTRKRQDKGGGKKQKKFRVKSWYANRYQFVVVQRNILLIFALFSTIAVSFGMIFLNHVVSSKSLEPYVIEVEEKTGIPTVVDQLTVEEFTGNELMKKYFINQFVHASTGYNAKTYPQDAEKVRVFSNPSVFGSFRSRIKPRDLGTNTKMVIKIKSIQLPNETTAQIRILKQTYVGISNDLTESNELVTLNFFFDPDINLNIQERLLNPLGFQVKNYSLVEEIISY